MKKLFILTCTLLCMHTAQAQAHFPTQGVFAFNIMELRQKWVDYSDVYHLMNISNTVDLTIKGMTKLESYKGVFEEAYDYPIYPSKEDKGTATTFYMTYKNHQCLLSL